MLTNLAPSVASAFLARLFAGYGADAVAAAAVIDRLTPVAFGGLFALSGAIGPILAQNWGAGRFDRMRGVLREAVRVTLAYVALVWLVLALAQAPLASLFGLHGVAAELFGFFCRVGGAIWFFNGLLFLGNAAFNPRLPGALDAAELGTGDARHDPARDARRDALRTRGVVAGMGLGSLAFGTLGFLLARRTVDRLEGVGPPAAEPEARPGGAAPVGTASGRPRAPGAGELRRRARPAPEEDDLFIAAAAGRRKQSSAGRNWYFAAQRVTMPARAGPAGAGSRRHVQSARDVPGPGRGRLQTMAQQFGLTTEQTARAFEALMPALTFGLQRSVGMDLGSSTGQFARCLAWRPPGWGHQVPRCAHPYVRLGRS